MALGNILKEARMRKKLSASEVAAGTRMKVQLVAAIEQEDYSAFPAPIYGKGFIKLFAEHVDIDPAPLIDEYVNAIANGNISQPAPAPTHKTRKILIDTEPLIDESTKDKKTTDKKRPVQVKSPIEKEKQESKSATEEKPPADDLFSRIEPENKQTEKTLFHPKESAPITKSETIVESSPETKPIPMEESLPAKEPAITPVIEPAPITEEITPIIDAEPIINLESDTKEEEENQYNKPIPVIHQVSLASTPVPTEKQSETKSSPSPMKKRAADASISLKKLNLSESHIKAASISVGILILLILITSTISRCSHNKKEKIVPSTNETLQLAIPPADPYLE